MTAAPAPLEELPPRNPRAFGLFLTDDELRMLLAAISGVPSTVRAVVYGSRQSGLRRKKPKPEPLDIDVAIDVHTKYPDDREHVFMQAVAAIKAAPGLRLQVDDLNSTTSRYHGDRRAGVVIFDRPGP